MINRSDCSFFHTIDLPGETTPGLWDFRKTEAAYHGEYDFKHKRVLEIGAASGCHSFWLESQGADVVPYDLAPHLSWDVMTTFEQDPAQVDQEMRRIIRTLNNSWWYSAERLNSRLKLTHGTIYDVPAELGEFDVITLGSVLLHTRDPIGAVQRLAHRTKTIVVMDRFIPRGNPEAATMRFLPKIEKANQFGGWTWYWFTPGVFKQLLKILGFSRFTLSTAKHHHAQGGKDIELFTLIAER